MKVSICRVFGFVFELVSGFVSAVRVRVRVGVRVCFGSGLVLSSYLFRIRRMRFGNNLLRKYFLENIYKYISIFFSFIKIYFIKIIIIIFLLVF